MIIRIDVEPTDDRHRIEGVAAAVSLMLASGDMVLVGEARPRASHPMADDGSGPTVGGEV